jgi:hypothetical protein
MIFSVDYGNPGFPDASGASICLDPGSLDPAQAQNPVFWCISTSAADSGDLGTPGAPNDNCQIVN